MEDVPEWERSKENVEPRKQGRCVDTLTRGLTAQTETKSLESLRKEKEGFELALRSYRGDDPLSVWDEYIRWTEQNFPSGGKNSPLTQLLSSCLKNFYNDDDAYKSDERYIRHWILFADRTQEPLEAFKRMNSKGIGTKSTAFYKAWALAAEENGNSKQADVILAQGLKAGAEPASVLQRFREELQTRTCRIMMEKLTAGDSEDGAEKGTSPQRQSLVTLAASSKGRVAHDRISSSRSDVKAIVKSVSKTPTGNVPLQVFHDENAPNSVALTTSIGKYKTIPDSEMYAENTQSAGKWTQPKNSKLKKPLATAPLETVPVFQVHCDPVQTTATPCKTANIGKASGLSVKKTTGKKDNDPTVDLRSVTQEFVQEVPMYSKFKVYAGVSEYSIEELRAIKWRKEQEAANRLAQQWSTLDKKVANLNEKLQQFGLADRMLLSGMQSMNVEDMKSVLVYGLTKYEELLSTIARNHEEITQENKRLEDEVKKLQAEISVTNQSYEFKSQQLEQEVKRLRAELSQFQSSVDQSDAFKTPKDKTSAFKQVSSKRHRTPDNSSSKKSFTQIHLSSFTQDCNHLVNNLFNQTIAFPAAEDGEKNNSKNTDSSDCFKVPLQPEVPKAPSGLPAKSTFEIFVDSDDRSGGNIRQENASSAKSLENVENTTKSVAGFTIFDDENLRLQNATEDQLASSSKHASSTHSRDKMGSSPPDFHQTVCAGHAGQDSMECDTNTQYDLDSHRPALARSTPCHPVNHVTQSQVNRGTESGSSNSVFTGAPGIPAQLTKCIAAHQLSAITERSSSSDVNSGLSSLTRSRSQCGSSDSDTAGEYLDHSNQTRSKLLLQPTAPTLDVVSEVSESKSEIAAEEEGRPMAWATPVIDTTHFQPPELTEFTLNTTMFVDPSDPFQERLQAKFLKKVNFSSMDDVEICDGNMPKLFKGCRLDICDEKFKMMEKLGDGGFAKVYKAVVTSQSLEASKSSMLSSRRSLMNQTVLNEGDEVCIKLQKPACSWELYICRELRDRILGLGHELLARNPVSRIMEVSHAKIYSDGSLLVNELVRFGNILNVVNTFSAKKFTPPESIIMLIAIDLLQTVEFLHRCRIIHGDIKPDNVLFLGFPEFEVESPFSSSTIRLIDFGRSIDMSKFPRDTTFTASNQTEGFICIEMKTGQPWTYQTDYFGIVGTLFTLLFKTYMKVEYKGGRWKPLGFKLNRSYNSTLWQSLFDEFLNIPSCDELPDLAEWREKFESEFLHGSGLAEYASSWSSVNDLLGIQK